VYTKYKPATEVPDGLYGEEMAAFTESLAGSPAATEDSLDLGLGGMDWHELFTDPHLQALIGQGLQNNTDYQSAQLRVEEAEATLLSAKLAFLPSFALAPQGTVSSFDSRKATQTYSLPVTASWELDFGGTRRVYIATMQPFGAEGQARIARHRKMRAAKKFSTIECYTNLKEVELEPGSDVLLECMSNLTANEIFDPSGAGKARAEEEILAGVSRLAHQARNLVLVTNEIFSDGYRYEEETMEYQRILGNINVRLAEMADCVTEVVYGIPVRIKKE
jgi:adenosylcobinamide kinase/adenosylcobinamide-phosphate guanylyltransferase